MYSDAQNVSRLQAFKASTCLFQFEMQMDETKISQNCFKYHLEIFLKLLAKIAHKLPVDNRFYNVNCMQVHPKIKIYFDFK